EPPHPAAGQRLGRPRTHAAHAHHADMALRQLRHAAGAVQALDAGETFVRVGDIAHRKTRWYGARHALRKAAILSPGSGEPGYPREPVLIQGIHDACRTPDPARPGHRRARYVPGDECARRTQPDAEGGDAYHGLPHGRTEAGDEGAEVRRGDDPAPPVAPA